MRKRYEHTAEESGREHGTRRRRGRLTRQQKGLLAICLVLALAVVLVLVYRSLVVRPDIPNGETKKDEEKIDYGDGVQPRADGARKSDSWYTVLILGRDTGGGGNTDTMLLASYDVTNQKATVMSIPRDTMVNVSWDIKRINSVYNYYGGGDKGIQALYKEISQLVGFEPDYQVVVEWEAVGKIVEAMGGVYFDVPRNMNYDDPTQIEAARVAMTRYTKRGGQVWIKIFPDKPVTKKPADTRMGSGKGSPEFWVAVVKPGRVMFEIAGVPEEVAREALRLASHKLPIKTKVIAAEAASEVQEAGE